MPGRSTLIRRLPVMRTLYRSAPLVLLLCAGLSACATGSADIAEDPYAFTSTNRPPRVRIVVRNMNFNDVRLFALSPSGRTSIGHVGGKQESEFEIDWRMSAFMSIEINMVAGPKCQTQEMQVDPGDILELQIAVVFQQTAGCR
ncbi:MAG: hypothetical protein L7S64_08240 [Longimicrobiales bacterium]|nr:hypothetical protein [Longimicrobiales bacterium]